ncbi:hypothetical protein D3C87_1794430 [compost metagenome]
MVAVKPGLRQVFKLLVFRDLIGRQVAVVIDNRHFLRIIMVKDTRGFRTEEEIFGNEGLLYCGANRFHSLSCYNHKLLSIPYSSPRSSASPRRRPIAV